MDFAIAHFVVSKDATSKDLELLLVKTPAQLVAISYDGFMDGSQTIPPQA